MSVPRIYQAQAIKINTFLYLHRAASHHIATVLRAKVGAVIELFNGDGYRYGGEISSINKHEVMVLIKNAILANNESTLHVQLAQAVSRGEKMDWIIQKAVELGVKEIFPLLSERTNVQLPEARLNKKMAHWQAVMISACEQCGRCTLPTLHSPQTFTSYLSSLTAEVAFILAPGFNTSLHQYQITKKQNVSLLIGPEGGFSETEIKLALSKGCHPLALGPRILRTETAAIAALSVLQFYRGDF